MSFIILVPCDKNGHVDTEKSTSCQSIKLDKELPVHLGRNPLTGIVDKKLSRQQLEIIPNFGKKLLEVKQLGFHPSYGNFQQMREGEQLSLSQDQTFSLLKDKYHFKVQFYPETDGEPTTNSSLQGKKHKSKRTPQDSEERRSKKLKTETKDMNIDCENDFEELSVEMKLKKLQENVRNEAKEEYESHGRMEQEGQSKEEKILSKESGKQRTPPSKPLVGHWSLGLLDSMNNPELQVFQDDVVVAIKDKYPKARHHFLILPKQKIPNLKSLKPEHVDLLKHLHKIGEKMIQESIGDAPLTYRLGYHAVPSMSHLHMHAISQDFDSPCLKTKKHWNSFTSDYFVNSKDIIQQLEEQGKVDTSSRNPSEMLKLPLKCHVCKADLPNMPKLKTHILKHIQVR